MAKRRPTGARAKVEPNNPENKHFLRNLILTILAGVFIITAAIIGAFFTGLFAHFWDKTFTAQPKEPIKPEVTLTTPSPTPPGTQPVPDPGNITNTGQVTIPANIQKTPPKVTPTSIEAPKTNPAKKTQSMTKARQLAASGEYVAVIVECDRILAIDPNNKEAQNFKIWAQKRLRIQ